jgi:uncharacterized membrane protein YsdA (DUF1294 family)
LACRRAARLLDEAPVKSLDAIALTWAAALSGITFLLFGFDKWRAGRGGRRISEWTLVLWSAIGGWPGGFVAMRIFRHKTVKGTFQLKFAAALIPFGALMWAWWRWR